jgi:hypothetical protein
MKLWEIDAELDRILSTAVDEETGEITEEAAKALEELSIARAEKLENVALAYKMEMAFAESVKAERQALEKRQRQAERKAEWLKQYMQNSLQGEKFETPKVVVSYRKSQSVLIYDIGALPGEYLRYKDPEPDKTKIKNAIKDGASVPGAAIVENVSMSIK